MERVRQRRKKAHDIKQTQYNIETKEQTVLCDEVLL